LNALRARRRRSLPCRRPRRKPRPRRRCPLIAAAKTEGEVVWYTTQIIAPARESHERQLREDIRHQSALDPRQSPSCGQDHNESQAGRAAIRYLRRQVDGRGPPQKEGYRAQMAARSGQGRSSASVQGSAGYWVENNMFFLTRASTPASSPRDSGRAPYQWGGTARPQWRGKMAWSIAPTSSGGPACRYRDHRDGEDKGMAYLRVASRRWSCGRKRRRARCQISVIAGEYI